MCRCKISDHDLGTKLRQMEEFLEKGYQVTVSCTYEVKQKKWQVEYPQAVQVRCATPLHNVLLPERAAHDQNGSTLTHTRAKLDM